MAIKISLLVLLASLLASETKAYFMDLKMVSALAESSIT